jgi:hypothetical protein
MAIYRQRPKLTAAEVTRKYANHRPPPPQEIPPEPPLIGLHGRSRRTIPKRQPWLPAEPAAEPETDGSDQN